MVVSVIIPTLNEERYLANTLQFLTAVRNVEIIVVDGGSTDRTVEIARRYTEFVFLSRPGRAEQMNFGARHATGDVLLFLHADTLLLPGAIEMVRYQMRRVNVVGGAFDLHLDCDRPLMRWVERLATCRSRLTRAPYGDQGIFVRNRVFQRLNGFRPLHIFEDVDLSRRLRREGRIVFISDGLISSARRWAENGVLKTAAVCLLIRTLFVLRFPLHALARVHQRWLKRSPAAPPVTAPSAPRTTPRTGEAWSQP